MTNKNYKLSKFLRKAVELGASDLHIMANTPPKVRVNGKLVPLTVKKDGVTKQIALTAEECDMYIMDTMDEKVRNQYEKELSADYAIQIDGVGRFRVNASRSMGTKTLVARVLNTEPRTIEQLGLPDTLHKIAQHKNGIVLVTGATGSGKSATLSAMIDDINKSKFVNIITIEDPVETLHRSHKASVMQKEIGRDTLSFNTAMREAMREDPDVILIGEMRDPETVKTAIHAAETGHLVLSTLHTTSASDTLNRIIDFFPPYEHNQIRISLAESLRAIISQRLLLSSDGKSRLPAMELLLNEGNIPAAIAKGESKEIKNILENDRNRGMQTFEDALITLIRDGKITVAEAMTNTTNAHDLDVALSRLNLKGE